jgi:CelD/BcsL family acetyltransferase involved in cellulose biosynthesis
MRPAYKAACQIDWVETLDGVDALAAEWAELESVTPEATGFQSFAWCRAWLRLAVGRASPLILCLRESERPVMILPLQVERRFGVSIARWIGEPMTQYGDALAREGDGRVRWRRIASGAMERRRDVDLFALTRLRADGVLADGAARGERLSAPYVDCREPRPRRRKSVERRLRRLEARGSVALVEIGPPERRERLARHAFALKREWLRRKGVYSAGLSNPISEEFIAALAREGSVCVNALEVGGEIAALDLGMVGGDAYRSVLGCYDNAFAEGSPGQALTERLISRCAERGLSAYDMLLPADDYKLVWATGETPIEARFVATGLKGAIAALVLSRLRPLAKGAMHAAGPLRAKLAGTFSFARNPVRLLSR